MSLLIKKKYIYIHQIMVVLASTSVLPSDLEIKLNFNIFSNKNKIIQKCLQRKESRRD